MNSGRIWSLISLTENRYLGLVSTFTPIRVRLFPGISRKWSWTLATSTYPILGDSVLIPSISTTMPPKVLIAGLLRSIHIFGSDQLIERSPPSSNEFTRQAFAIEVRANERLCDHRRHEVLSRAINEGIIWELVNAFAIWSRGLN